MRWERGSSDLAQDEGNSAIGWDVKSGVAEVLTGLGQNFVKRASNSRGFWLSVEWSRALSPLLVWGADVLFCFVFFVFVCCVGPAEVARFSAEAGVSV